MFLDRFLGPFVLALPLLRELQNLIRRGLGLLDEALHDDDGGPALEKDEAGNLLVRQVAANLVEPVSELPAKRHAERPADLNGPEVRANDAAVVQIQASKPFEDGFIPCLRLVENHFQLFGHDLSPGSSLPPFLGLP